jgi:ATP-dependent Clp protease ATP-binding subunit ClpA
LQEKRVLSIDLAAIMAGSGIRGQFEEKFKALIRDIEDEVSYRIDSVVPFYGQKFISLCRTI